MRYVPNSSHNPYFNQALEELLFEQSREPLLLLWRNAPAVVCGRYQNLFAEVSVPAAQAEGIALVRRITGGGTVYHDLGNLNYSLIQNSDVPGYEPYLHRMADALQRIGVPAVPSRSCDLSLDGKKISGSAQKIAHGRTLHHGTLLFETDLGKLRRVANGASADYESRGVASQPWPVTNIRDHCNAFADVEQFQTALLEALSVDGIREITAEERMAAQELALRRYQSWDWTFGKSPDFTLRRKEWAIRVKKGIIASAEGLPGELLGCPLELSALLSRGIDPSLAAQLL